MGDSDFFYYFFPDCLLVIDILPILHWDISEGNIVECIFERSKDKQARKIVGTEYF